MVKRKRDFGTMLFDKADINDHKSVDIYTFIPSVDINWKKRIEKYIDTIRNRNDRLIENYTTLDLDDHVAISVMLKNDNIMGFSTVWNRKFYGDNTVRIFNRWWEDPKLRKTSKIIGDTHLVAVANHQLQIAKENGYEWVFISREKTPNYLKKIVETLDKSTEYKWISYPKKIPVCCRTQDVCWQWIGYTNLNHNNDNWSMLDESI